MTPRQRRGVFGALISALVLGTSPWAQSTVVAPAVDLTRLSVGGDRVSAPMAAGDMAELTLDPHLELTAQRLLDQANAREGAIVALDPRTGRLLAWSESGGDRGQSVVTTARVPAASVFKLVTAAALLETGGAHPKERVCISGGARGIERRHLDPPTEGEISCAPFSEALGHSRNAVFAQLATHRLLRADLITVAERLGFNSVLPFDWPVPVGHLTVPYNDLAFARTAVGFQGSTLSPLGGAYLAAIIARGGVAPRLHLIARAGDHRAPLEPELLPRVLDATTAWRLTRMMEVTIHSGTSRPSFVDQAGRSLLPGVRVAGKTGTLRPESGEFTTSWFVGFAPSRRPEIVVSVMLQNRPVWRKRAAEVARDLFRAYFHHRGTRGIEAPFAPAARVSAR